MGFLEQDWADAIALELKRTGQLGVKPVAAALRKASAGGLKLAATILWDNNFKDDCFDMICREADKLDPPPLPDRQGNRMTTDAITPTEMRENIKMLNEFIELIASMADDAAEKQAFRCTSGSEALLIFAESLRVMTRKASLEVINLTKEH